MSAKTKRSFHFPIKLVFYFYLFFFLQNSLVKSRKLRHLKNSPIRYWIKSPNDKHKMSSSSKVYHPWSDMNSRVLTCDVYVVIWSSEIVDRRISRSIISCYRNIKIQKAIKFINKPQSKFVRSFILTVIDFEDSDCAVRGPP